MAMARACAARFSNFKKANYRGPRAKSARRFFISVLSVLTCAQSALAAPFVTPSERVTHNVVVRRQPSSNEKLGALNPGESAELLDQVPGWYHIRLSDGREGYVSKAWTILTGAGAPAAATAQPLRVHVIDVGTGLATFIEAPGVTILYDAGSQDDLADGADNRVVSYIKAIRPDVRTIDHVILSHPHKDHLELMQDVFGAYEIKNVWDSGTVNKTRGYCRFLKAVAAEPGVKYHDSIESSGLHSVAFTGKSCSGTVTIPEAPMMTDQPVALGPGLSMSFLYRNFQHHADPNENTVVVRVDYGNNRVLLAGDAEGGGRQAPTAPPSPLSIEGQLLATNAAGIKADVLIVGHHGSKTSSRQAFIAAVGAKIFVISSGPHPYSGVTLPDQEVKDELAPLGTLLLTNVNDDTCGENEAKIGPDADESPGGCDNVIVTVPAAGQASAAYYHTAD